MNARSSSSWFDYGVVFFVIMGTFGLAGCFSNTQGDKSSVDLLKQARSKKGGSPEQISSYQQGIAAAHVELGQIYVEYSQYQEAAKSLEIARSFAPQNRGILSLLGKSYRQLGDFYYQKQDDLQAACAYRLLRSFSTAEDVSQAEITKLITKAEETLKDVTKNA